MNRRLYFLFPSPKTAETAVKELIQLGIRRDYIHTLARDDVDISGLPSITPRQRYGLRERLARVYWNSELIVFFLALAGLLTAIALNSLSGVAVALIAMTASFLSGAFYATHVPDTTLSDFKEALAHREVLLLVDVPRQRIAEVEANIHKHHPAAVAGGSSWTIDALGI